MTETMTVRELMERLTAFPDDATVRMFGEEGATLMVSWGGNDDNDTVVMEEVPGRQCWEH